MVLSLKILDLIDEGLQPHGAPHRLQAGGTEAYKQMLASLLLDQVASVFAVLGHDLDSKTPGQVSEDAFRTFRPDSLRKRQVSLFLACVRTPDCSKSRPSRLPAEGWRTSRKAAATAVGAPSMLTSAKPSAEAPSTSVHTRVQTVTAALARGEP